MPFGLHIPLPGPFTYYHRIGGRRGKRAAPAAMPPRTEAEERFAVAGLVACMVLLLAVFAGWWTIPVVGLVVGGCAWSRRRNR